MATQNPGIRIPSPNEAHKAVRLALQQIVRRLGISSAPTFSGFTLTGDLTLSGATASRILATNASKVVVSVDNFTAWVAGTTNQITVTDDGDGTVTLSLPQDIHTGASPYWEEVNVGHATDTTITRPSAGNLDVEGNRIYRAGGIDVPVTDGGTGASTAPVARTNLGLGNVENTALSTWAGSTNVITLGTIATGVWSGTALVAGKVPAHDDLTGFVAAEHIAHSTGGDGTHNVYNEGTTGDLATITVLNGLITGVTKVP